MALDAAHAVFAQAHSGSRGPFQATGPGGSPVADHWTQIVDPQIAGSAPDDFPLLSPFFPLMAVVLYMLGTPLLSLICRQLGVTGDGTGFKVFAVFHNALLLAYSAWACYQVFPLWIGSFFERGYWATYCDDGGQLRVQTAAHVYLNYLSKCYEFLDTALLIAARKRVSWLQSYHHAGIVLIMWSCSVTRHPHGLFMVGLNSLVHTVMYLYFLCTLIPFLPRSSYSFVKPWITRFQLFQFFCGLTVAVPAFLGLIGLWGKPFGRGRMEDCLTNPQAFATAFTMFYLIVLVLLFGNFYYRSYVAQKKQRSKLE